MRHNILLAAVAASLATTAMAQNYNVKGIIPGLRRGTKVSLRSLEQDRKIDAKCTADDNTFVLSGTVQSPMLVELRINDKPDYEYKEDEYPKTRGTKFMLEGTDYSVSATHFDSIPFNISLTESLLKNAGHIKVEGGEVQRQYREWEDATYQLRLEAEKANVEYCKERFGENVKAQGYDTLKAERLEETAIRKYQEVDEENSRFISAHHTYAISLLLQKKAINSPFAFTIEECDSLISRFADNYDHQRFSDFKSYINEMKRFPKYADLRDLKVFTPDNKPVQLKDIVIRGKWNFIDFWASWCGPCRAAIPSVKKMYEKMGGRLNIISISVDRNNTEWQRAMKEEQMPWTQYIVPQTEMKSLEEAYYVRFIPALIAVSPEGKISLYTGDPSEAHAYLKDKLY